MSEKIQGQNGVGIGNGDPAGRLGSTKQRLDPSQKLSPGYRLSHVFISPQLQPADQMLLFAQSSKRQNVGVRYVSGCAG